MAPTPTLNYNFKDGNVIIIGGRRIGGFGEDGGIEYELASDIYEDVNGADGQTTISELNDHRLYATITVMETSKSYKQLFNMLTTQRAQLIKLPLPFAHRDQINGDLVTDAQTIFLTWPAPSKSRTAGEREFRILLPNGADNMKLGQQNFV